MEKRILKLELILAGFLFFLPLLLIVFTNEVRPSISDYVYSSGNHYFSVLLTLASSLFLYNGVINRRKWYNIVLGLSLIGVVVTPHLDYPVLHYFFAALFFIGSMLVMVVYTSSRFKKLTLTLALLILLGLLGYFVLDMYSLFYAEWIGIAPITTHFILESLKIID